MPQVIENFLERELSYKIRGCFYNIRNKYGRFHHERVYDRVLSEQLHLLSLPFIDKPKIPIYSLDTGKKIALCIPDKLIANKIIVEIKAKPYTTKEDGKQAMEYLKTSEYEIIYLVNFGEENFNPLRFIFTNNRKHFISLIKSTDPCIRVNP